MKKLIIFTVLISVITLGGLWSGRKFCTMMLTHSGMRSGQVLLSEMRLNKAQTEEVERFETSFRRDVDAHCMIVCQKRILLLEQIKDKSIKSETIYEKVEEIGQLQISLEKKVIAHILEVDKGLNASQSKAYLEGIYRQQCQMIAQSGYGESVEKK